MTNATEAKITAQACAAELTQEAKTTRRVLERVPEDRLDWRPHPKARSLGQLALHVASIPGRISRMAQGDGMDASQTRSEPATPSSTAELLPMLDAGVRDAVAFLTGIDGETAAATWRLTHGENELFAIPRVAVIRTVLLNHWYHHRGQLQLYLRMLDLPVPAVFGPSADEAAFPGGARA
jgi:uncharacterized damage-inducible protein DinB